ncbi:MAG TPA: BMP family ABC transporter substrate-binding protein [Candidatus Dormibacteraeota bacterium]
MRSIRSLAAIAAFAVAALACGGGGGTSGTSGGSGCSKTYKVGLVTDVGKLSDKSFNATSWQGVLDAQNDKSLCIQGKAIESNQPTDYATNMQTFVDQGYDMVVAVGFLMGDDTLKEAKKNPKTKFAIVDYAYDPQKDQPPSNLVGLVFKEDQAGFLIGALAGYMTKTGQVGQVLGLKIPPVQRYGEGYIAGVKYANPSAKTVLTVYQGASDGAPFNNPDWGKARAIDEANQGADIIFGGGGNTGNGALLGALSKNIACIGVDTDQYLSYPDADKCLMTSAEKKLATAVKTAITDMVKSQWPANNLLTFDASNGGVGIAPYHDYDSKIPADVKAKITDIQSKLASGSLKTGVNA